MANQLPVEELEIVSVDISESEMDALASRIASLHRQTTLAFAVELGRIVIEGLYGGDLALWRSRAKSDGSLRKLAARLATRGVVGLSATALQQAIATLDLDRRVAVASRPQLTVTHVRAVVGLPDANQEQLLGTAESKDWSATKLEREAAKVRAKLASRPGRPAMPMFVKSVNRWERELKDRRALFAGLETAAKLPSEDRARLRETAAAMRAHCDALLIALAEPAA